jgi:hypothetical protein
VHPKYIPELRHKLNLQRYVLAKYMKQNTPVLFVNRYEGQPNKHNDFMMPATLTKEAGANILTKSIDKSHENWAWAKNLQVAT